MAHTIVASDELPHSGSAQVRGIPPWRRERLVLPVGDDAVEAPSGHIVVAPAGMPHKFVDSDAGHARHIDIHTSGRMITEWLDDERSHGGTGGGSR